MQGYIERIIRAALLVFISFVLIGLLASIFIPKLTTEEIAPQAEELAKDKLSFKDNSWSLDGFGNIYMGNFKIYNDSEQNIKDISIECTVSGESGTELGKTSTTIYENIKAKSTRKFKQVNMGFVNSQSATSNCEITAAVFN